MFIVMCLAAPSLLAVAIGAVRYVKVTRAEKLYWARRDGGLELEGDDEALALRRPA